jgi:hypothetical protein
MAYKIKKLPTKKQAEVYFKLRKKRISPKDADNFIKYFVTKEGKIKNL